MEVCMDCVVKVLRELGASERQAQKVLWAMRKHSLGGLGHAHVSGKEVAEMTMLEVTWKEVG